MQRDLAEEIRKQFDDYYQDRLDLEDRLRDLEKFMWQHQKPGSETRVKAAAAAETTKSRWEFWKAIIVQALITLGMVLAAWAALPKK